MGSGQGQRFRAVVRKVDPGSVVQSAWQLGHVRPDDVLCAIGGAGVHDDPVIDDGQHTVQTPAYDQCLVLHDHAQANARFVLIHGSS